MCHIGMQKAGSKAIQHFSLANQDALSKHGVTYARLTEKGAWHRTLFKDYDDTIDDAVAGLCRDHGRVVFSFEKAYVVDDDVIRRFTGHGASCHVFFVVREPVSWVNSWMNQIVKAHTSSHRQFKRFAVGSDNIAAVLSVDQQLARWETVVGRDNITAIEYIPQVNVLDAYLEWLQIGDDARADFDFAPGDPNRALDERSIRVFINVKRRAQKLDRTNLSRVMREAHARLTDIAQADSTPFRLVDDEMAAQIVETYQPAFDAVMARYGRGNQPTHFDETRAALLKRRVLNDFTPKDDEKRIAGQILRAA